MTEIGPVGGGQLRGEALEERTEARQLADVTNAGKASLAMLAGNMQKEIHTIMQRNRLHV